MARADSVGITVKRDCEIRWSSKADTRKMTYNNYEECTDHLVQMSRNGGTRAAHGCRIVFVDRGVALKMIFILLKLMLLEKW